VETGAQRRWAAPAESPHGLLVLIYDRPAKEQPFEKPDDSLPEMVH